MRNRLFNKALSFVLYFVLLAEGFAASGQSSKNSKASASDCTGAWTGVVKYTRTQSMSENTTEDRISGRGQDTRSWEMKYDYKAIVAVVDAPERDGSIVGKATITHSFTSMDTTTAVEKNSCDRGKTWQDMTGTFTSQSTTSGNGKEDANVHVGISADGSYSVSVGIPPINGIMSGSETATFSGQCKPKEGTNNTFAPTPTSIDGNSLTSDGSHRIDPAEPNQLSGSYTLDLPGGGAETITWNLQKCGAPLRIVELKFEDMKFPKWDDWQEISDQKGTIDGNRVKIKAHILNASGETKSGEIVFKETYKGDHWDSGRPDAPLGDQTFSFTLEGGEEQEVEMLWDSSGYAWFDDGRPRLVQRIKAELREGSKKVDEKTKNLKVAPKPIVFVPGMWTDPGDIEYYQNLLTTTHSYDWKSYGVIDVSSQGTIAGEGTVKEFKSVSTVYDYADNAAKYIENVRKDRNAWHIDMLAHCTGGLVARLYIHKQMETLPDNLPVVKHLMMLGTPNNGVPCPGLMLLSGAFVDNDQTKKELGEEEIALFNQYVTARKGTKFSALAGNLLPVMCDGPKWHDGFVTVQSATHGIEDVAYTKALHGDMLTTQTFANYVRPHVITGPKGSYPYPVVSVELLEHISFE